MFENAERAEVATEGADRDSILKKFGSLKKIPGNSLCKTLVSLQQLETFTRSFIQFLACVNQAGYAT